jgi:hypothetical protein
VDLNHKNQHHHNFVNINFPQNKIINRPKRECTFLLTEDEPLRELTAQIQTFLYSFNTLILSIEILPTAFVSFKINSLSKYNIPSL